MASYSANAKFQEHLISRNLLDDAIEWIRDNLKPDDVFGIDQLKDWAEDNGYEKPE